MADKKVGSPAKSPAKVSAEEKHDQKVNALLDKVEGKTEVAAEDEANRGIPKSEFIVSAACNICSSIFANQKHLYVSLACRVCGRSCGV